MDASGIDVEQLLGYLADPRTVSLSSLRYVLNAKKMDPNNQINATNLARKKMQLVFKNNAKLILKPQAQGGIGLARVQALFGNSINSEQDFLDLISNISGNPIFDFVITN